MKTLIKLIDNNGLHDVVGGNAIFGSKLGYPIYSDPDRMVAIVLRFLEDHRDLKAGLRTECTGGAVAGVGFGAHK